MLIKLLVAFGLMAVCVVLHAAGLTVVIRWLRRSLPSFAHKPARQLRLLIVVASWAVLVHLAEITVWALYYAGGGGMPDLDTALYFSAVTYTTVGYGDLVLPAEWRLVGGIEALTGILMCGWSTAYFLAVVNQVFIRNEGATASVPRQEGS
jgi:voltage-gated potassium channel Kch